MAKGGLGNMMKQVQQMQAMMEQMQAELEKTEVEAAAGGGMVKVVANGKHDILSIVIDPEGAIVGKYRKTHFSQGYRTGQHKGDNPPGYTRGENYPVFDMGGRKLGVMICYDRRVPSVARRLAENGAELIVNPAYGRMGDCNRELISARAKENGVPILFVHPKQVIFAAPDGTIQIDRRAKTKQARPAVVLA